MPTINFNPTAPAETAPGGFQTIRATPQAFGAPQGAALENLGQRFEQAGDALQNIVVQRQQLFNQVAVDEASLKWREGVERLMYGDPNNPADVGFNGLKGRAAMDAYPNVRKRFDELAKEHRGVLQNPVQQSMFDRANAQSRLFTINEMGRKYDSSNNEWTKSVYVGQEKLASQDMAKAAAAGDDNALQKAISERIAAVTKLGVFSGLDETMTKAKINEITAEAVEMKFEGMVVDDPVRAKQFLDNNADKLPPDKRIQLNGRVEARAREQKAQDWADGKPVGGGLVRGGAIKPADHYGFLTSIGASPNEAALLTSAAGAESGFVPTSTHDADILAKRGQSPGYGLYGHNAERLAAMRKEYGPNPTWEQQAQFALKELRSRPEGARVNTAKTPEELTELQFEFERPKRGPGDQTAIRLATTREYMQNPPAGEENKISIAGAGPDAPTYRLTQEQARQYYAIKDFKAQQDFLKSTTVADTVVTPPPLADGEAPDDQIPGLSKEIERVLKDPEAKRDPLAAKAAISILRQRANDAWSGQQRQRMLQEQAVQAQDKAITDEYLKRMTSASPNYPTLDEVKIDQRLSVPAKQNMIGLLRSDTRPETDASRSASVQQQMFARMMPDYAGPDRILSTRDIDKARANKELTDSDWRSLRKDFENLYDPNSPSQVRKVERVFKGIEAKLVPGVGTMGRGMAYEMDEGAGARVQRWREGAKAKIHEYLDTGKDTSILFQPGTPDKPNPEYIGGDAFVSEYQEKPSERMQDKKPLAGPRGTAQALKQIEAATSPAELNAVVQQFPLLLDAARAQAITKGWARPTREVPMAR